MKIISTVAGVGATLALAASPALAAGPPPSATHAYGKFCQNQSKKHVAGKSGTPFSQCVTALAKADKSDATTAREACRSMSKKHVAGSKGTPFSRCVVAVAQMRKSQSPTTTG